MRKTAVAFLLTATPAILGAQSTAGANAQATAQVALSAESQARIDATIAAAAEKKLPAQPIRDRVAEGQAKGASEAQLVLAAQRVEARMEAAQEAMLRAGRQPTDGEVTRSEHAMARGATDVQIEVLAKRTPPERSLEVALDVLTQLQARGVATEQALAQITSKLEARASDAALRELTAGVNVNAGASGAVAKPKAGASATAGAAAGAAGVAGTAAGAVGAVIKPPVL